MNEHGFSFVETILGMVILFFLSATLIPVTFYMKQQMAEQKMQTHAAEVAFNGALKYSRFGEQNGHQEINGVLYEWQVLGHQICVAYKNNNDGKTEEVCV